jgi:hypothetical protein
LEYHPKVAAKAKMTIGSTENFDVIDRGSIPVGFQKLRDVEKGDVYLKAKTADRKNTGSYYTPQWVVSATVNLSGLSERIANSKTLEELQSIRLCDPAMGSGHFLVDVAQHIARRAQSLYVDGSKDSVDETVLESVRSTIIGVDKNDLAVILSKLNFWILLGRRGKKLPSLDSNLKVGNSLIYSPNAKRTSISNWFDWKAEFSTEVEEFGGFEFIIGNPPWGGDISFEKANIEGLYSGTALDNLNSFELFIRQAERLLSTNGTLAFVLPRNFIRTHDYSSIRKHIGKKIKFIGDIGAAFDGVMQEAVIFGMGKEEQSSFLSYPYLKTLDLGDDIRADKVIRVATASIKAPSYSFNMYSTKELEGINAKQDAAKLAALSTKVKRSRGIEYGGNGEVGKCPHCAKYITRPRKKRRDWKNCDFCGKEVSLQDLPPYYMISKEKTDRHIVPIYSGRDVQRYYCRSPRYLQLKLSGINYKAKWFDGAPSILISKISDNIRCDIALEGEYVTQGVYLLKEVDPQFPLLWIAAVLNSEVMRFFYEYRHNVGASLTTNVLLDHIVMTRIPGAPSAAMKRIEKYVKIIKSSGPESTKSKTASDAIDEIVFKAYGLRTKQVAEVRAYLEMIEELKAIVKRQVRKGRVKGIESPAISEEESDSIDVA